MNANRKSALQLAWNMVRTAGLSFSDAQRKAWASIKLRTQMAVKPVSFFYTKEKGEVRFAVGFYGAAPVSNKPVDLTTVASGLTVKYYDTIVGGWRSFRADRILL